MLWRYVGNKVREKGTNQRKMDIWAGLISREDFSERTLLAKGRISGSFFLLLEALGFFLATYKRRSFEKLRKQTNDNRFRARAVVHVPPNLAAHYCILSELRLWLRFLQTYLFIISFFPSDLRLRGLFGRITPCCAFSLFSPVRARALFLPPLSVIT